MIKRTREPLLYIVQKVWGREREYIFTKLYCSSFSVEIGETADSKPKRRKLG